MELITKQTSNYFSPLRYPGGKASLSNFLGGVISSCGIKDCTYVEPYAGGAGAALELLFLERVHKIIINDFDKAIYAIWYCILNEFDDFCQKIRNTELNLKEWEHQKHIYNSNTESMLDLGFSALYLNRTNRSGIINAGPIGGMQQNGNYKIDARFKKEKIISRLEKIFFYKKRIEIRNQDGIELMNEIKSGSTFFYIDPPYYVKGRDLYLNHYSDKDHLMLSNFLNQNSDIFWLLTYDNVEEIKKLYPVRRHCDFSLNYYAGDIKKGKEVMFFSDSIILPDSGHNKQLSIFDQDATLT